MQNLRLRHILGSALALLVLLAGCESNQREVDVATAQPAEVTVDMKARNFAFDPGRIVAREGDTLILHVTNVAKEKHDITIKDPSGKIIRSEDLPSGRMVTVKIPLSTAGVYPFYCDIDFHAGLGMKGRIEVQ
jgi:plastocyanin